MEKKEKQKPQRVGQGPIPNIPRFPQSNDGYGEKADKMYDYLREKSDQRKKSKKDK